MNYGLYLAASGTVNGMYRMDVLTNNLTNMTTVAFKPDLPGTQQRDAERIEDRLGSVPSNRLMERLGGGVFAAPNRTLFDQGAITRTGNELDLAIAGQGFFVARDQSNDGTDRLRLVRDGRMTRDAEGRLVSATSGMPILDVANRAITLKPGHADIDPDGTIRQRGEAVARIQLTTVQEASRLRKLGQGLFAADSDQMARREPAAGRIEQRAVEASAVDAVSTLTTIMQTQREIEASASLMQSHDRIAERAINGLGRVS
jgi:flagellar basal body rod protein FlgG